MSNSRIHVVLKHETLVDIFGSPHIDVIYIIDVVYMYVYIYIVCGELFFWFVSI